MHIQENPAAVPVQFFRALAEKHYARAWACLSSRSQEVFLHLLASAFQEAAYSAERLRHDFENGEGVARIYWGHFASQVQLENWLGLSYKALGSSGDNLLVEGQPAGINLVVVRENGRWRFGYMETFRDG
jgi:hypothetical protein